MESLKNLKAGDRVWVSTEKRPYKVRCRSDRYIICTKPMNIKKTVRYFIIDVMEGIRGPDNMVFCFGYETDEQCAERLAELESGTIEVSHRRRVPLDIIKVK